MKCHYGVGMVKGVTGEVLSRHFTSWQFVLVDEKAWEDLISALANLTDEEDLNYNRKLRFITVLHGRLILKLVPGTYLKPWTLKLVALLKLIYLLDSQ